MQIPVSLGKHNRIQDAYIMLHLNHTTPYQILFGSFFTNVNKHGKFQNMSLDDNDNEDSDRTSKILFYDDKIKFALDNELLFINIVNEYIGWSEYQKKISEVLSFFNEEHEVTVKRIELRYISVYDDIDLKNITEFKFSFAQPEVNSKRFRFTSEFDYDNAQVILNLVNKQITEDIEGNDVVNSYIDIALNKNDVQLNILDIDGVFGKLNHLHTIEKKIYFNLLAKDFLNSLSPKY